MPPPRLLLTVLPLAGVWAKPNLLFLQPSEVLCVGKKQLLNSLSDSGLVPRLEHTIKAVKSQKGLCRCPSADANKS